MPNINEILPFATGGSAASGDVMPLADYIADAQRLRGHQPGIARRELENTALRQTSHMSAGVAQFISHRFDPGVKDNGDLDKVEEGLAYAINSMIDAKTPPLATTTKSGLALRLATDAEAKTFTGKGLVDSTQLGYSVRKVCTGDLALYVRPDGNDSNDGSENIPAKAFKTINAALKKIYTYDGNGYKATINIAAGTYTEEVIISATSIIGFASIILQGGGKDMSIIAPPAANSSCVLAQSGAMVEVYDMGFRIPSGGGALRCYYGGKLTSARIAAVGLAGATDFLGTWAGGSVDCTTATISGSIGYPLRSNGMSTISPGGVWTVSGSCSCFAYAFSSALINCVGTNLSFVGSMTGTKYGGGTNSIFGTNGAGVNFFPGNVAGTLGSGAQYI